MRGHKNRLRFLSSLIIIGSAILLGKLYFVQIVHGSEYQAKAEHQYTASTNFFDRGSIFFTTKDGVRVPAASIDSGYILFINPKILKENNKSIEDVYAKINNIYAVNKTDFLAKANKTSDPYEEIAKEVDEDSALKIMALKISGLSTTPERWRSYPGGTIAAHTLGLIGYNSGNELAGRYGLERFYESTLARKQDDTFVNFFAEIFSNIKAAVSSDEKLQGDIVTTIEPTVEKELESEIRGVNSKYSSEFTGGIIINPKTGEIYAMALDPTFDPNNPQKQSSSAIFTNKLIEDRYEMGSIVKALTMAVGLDSKAITAKSTYNDPGCMTLNTKTFCNYDGQSHGTSLTMQTVLNKSLNTGAATVVARMGNKNFSQRMLAFGLENITGVDMPSEGKSLVANLHSTHDLELAQASFGQGIALTPIGTVRALSALANGGTLITPHVVKEVDYKIGVSKTVPITPEAERPRAISADASREISRMLTEVVDRSLKNGTVRLENYSVAAKTGTAQIANPNGGGYYADRYLHSFFGYFPSYDPEFLVFLYTYEPKGVEYASETLTDSFISITKFLINYYNIPPDRSAPPLPSP